MVLLEVVVVVERTRREEEEEEEKRDGEHVKESPHKKDGQSVVGGVQ